MNQKLALITLVVLDYDEAIEFYTVKLGFILIEDTVLSDNKRWVVIKPTGDSQTSILLAKADNPEQKRSIGNQTGGRVFLFLHTDNFWRDYQRMQENGVHFKELPRIEPYGIVAVFQDLYGNLWDLLEPK